MGGVDDDKCAWNRQVCAAEETRPITGRLNKGRFYKLVFNRRQGYYAASDGFAAIAP